MSFGLATFSCSQVARLRHLCSFRHLVLVVALWLTGVAFAAGCAGAVQWTAPALVRVLRSDVKPPTGFSLARYGRPNPSCWSLATAPVKPRRRLRRLAAEGFSSGVRLCYFELVRDGTHDDILVKLFVLGNVPAARRALETRFLQSRRRRLARHGLPPPQRVGNVVFYVFGDRAYADAVRKVWSAVRTRLTGAVR